MLIILLLHSFFLLGTHAIYISTCQVAIEEDRSWFATIRVFQDDLQDALVEDSGERPNLKDEQNVYYMQLLESYLHSHFTLTSQGVSISYRIVQYRHLNDVIEIALKGTRLWPTSTCNITCDILMELFDSQKNAMTITYKDKRKTLLFTKRKQSHENQL